MQCNGVKSPTFRQTEKNYTKYVREKRRNSQYLDGSPYRQKKHAIWDSHDGESVGYYVLGCTLMTCRLVASYQGFGGTSCLVLTIIHNSTSVRGTVIISFKIKAKLKNVSYMYTPSIVT